MRCNRNSGQRSWIQHIDCVELWYIYISTMKPTKLKNRNIQAHYTICLSKMQDGELVRGTEGMGTLEKGI